MFARALFGLVKSSIFRIFLSCCIIVMCVVYRINFIKMNVRLSWGGMFGT